MDTEQDQVMYPRILFEDMTKYQGMRATVVGNVCNEDQNDSLIIEFGPAGLNQHVVVDNQRRVDLNSSTKFVEIRGVITNQNTVTCEELTEFEQKDAFGVGNWKEINHFEFSDKANIVELELRTCMILGINDITEYYGEKISEEEQEEIKKSNIAKGKKENKLKDNIYQKLQQMQ